MEDRQRGGLVSLEGSAGGLVLHEALQQSINRYALPLRFLADSRFGLWRDVEAHANRSLLGIPVYFTTLSQICHAGWRRAKLSGFDVSRLGNPHSSTLTRPAPADENAGSGPPSPQGRGLSLPVAG